LPVEVGGQPPAAITVQQRVQAEAARRSRLLTGHAALAAALFDPSVPLADDSSALIRGLYWLTVNTTSAGVGTGITVDDVQWADRPSLSYLAYLAARIDELRAVLVIALRSGEPPADQQVIDRLSADGQLLKPSRLSPRAVAQMVHADFPAGGLTTLILMNKRCHKHAWVASFCCGGGSARHIGEDDRPVLQSLLAGKPEVQPGRQGRVLGLGFAGRWWPG
jgi:hypothetical protein